MKEATGELNMTVITVVAIAAVGALFTFFVWPNIQASLMLNTACSNVGAKGNYDNGSGTAAANNGGGEGEAATSNGSGDGTVKCVNFVCTATYSGRTYSTNCKANQ